MLDFLMISTRPTKRGLIEVYPRFIIKKSSDLMIRGGDFYAVWVEDRKMWSTDEQDALQLIDRELDIFVEENCKKFDGQVKILYMWDSENCMIDRWHKYCQKHMRDSFNALDETIIFSNHDLCKKDYASKKLSYPLENGDHSGWDKLVSTLYSEPERHKIEWAIGAIVSGESKYIQKFMVLYGSAGTGKSTILNIIQKLFDGYYSVFDAKALGSSSNSFALESFKSNPLVAIQHDGDLSRIEDNTRLNSLVSHELMTVNEKFKSTYSNRFKCFLFMGTNKPVKITDAKSGLIRRLIDVTPTGDKLTQKEYNQIMKKVSFELGAIAYHCQEVYLDNPSAYDDYIPIAMMGASNDFYNFVINSYHVFLNEDGTSLKAAWEMYKTYCEDAKVPYPLSQRSFKEELKNYFSDFSERFCAEDGSRIRSYYSGFKTNKFDQDMEAPKKKKERSSHKTLNLIEQPSIFDEYCSDCPAQYANNKETPSTRWDNVKNALKDIDTSKLHYVKVPENHIVIDFDLKDSNGEKSLERNLEAASKWPATYAELSKGGKGVHLHYIYSGDPSRLSRVSDEDSNIEIKVFSGKSSLRRKLTKCNNLPIAPISSGLPLKGDDGLINKKAVNNERGIRTLIKRNLAKEIHPGTKPSVDFIFKILEDAYNNGVKYDVSDMRNDIIAFAAGSSHQSDYCLKLTNKMHFKSEEPSDPGISKNDTLIFYDVEVFPNLFLVNWKERGKGKPVVRMINPSPSEIEKLCEYNLVGFNCRRYDNHIMYARMIGYSNEQLFELSKKIVSGDSKNCFFSEAYNLSYTDVYDFATTKQSLKKWEIDLGIHHQELGLPWDQPVPENMWTKVAEYCDNDVIATEAVFDAREGDFIARKLQVDLVKQLHGINNVSVNDTTNSLSTKIIFGTNRSPQSEFNYRDISKPVSWLCYDEYREKFGKDYVFHIFDENGLPTYQIYKDPDEALPDGYSILPFFPKYRYERGHSYYFKNIEDVSKPIDILDKDAYEILGEGGRVYSVPGMYVDVWDGDIASQHPHSAIEEVLFGPKYTKIFKDIVDARVAVKHMDFDAASKLLNGALIPYLTEEMAPALAQALKIVINSIYGLTSAAYENAFRDIRNIDNIVAKRGNVFMTMLRDEVEKLGYKVAHIKTDSIKIPNADEFIKDFVCKFGKEYGYTFETEADFDRFCIVNDAVYVAKTVDGEWVATGTQFQVPYVFKTLFSKEPIEFSDLCETKAVSTSLYLDMNETLPNVEEFETLKQLRSSDKKRTRRDQELIDKYSDMSDEDVQKNIDNGHDYKFVGKIGLFCPIKPGYGGGILTREGKDPKTGEVKYASATGAKGYRWLESEAVELLGYQDNTSSSYYNNIDRSYYDKLVDEAVDTISEFGDFEWFVSDDKEQDNPPWTLPCGNESCLDCKNLIMPSCECKRHFDIPENIVNELTKDDAFRKR